MTQPEPLFCLATPLVQALAESPTRRLRLVAGPRPADFDRLADTVVTLLHQAWATAAHVDELDAEPDAEDLAEIEAEWPVLAAELAVVDAHCRFLACPDVSTRRALRRAEAARDRTVAHHSHFCPSRNEGTHP